VIKKWLQALQLIRVCVVIAITDGVGIYGIPMHGYGFQVAISGLETFYHRLGVRTKQKSRRI